MSTWVQALTTSLLCLENLGGKHKGELAQLVKRSLSSNISCSYIPIESENFNHFNIFDTTNLASRKFFTHDSLTHTQARAFGGLPKGIINTILRRMSTNDTNEGGLSQEERRLQAKYKPQEIKFATPYGHVACLEWGHRGAPNKILCVHGWLDNAGSFERLIPYILDHKDNFHLYHVVAIDLPGVGHSSHRPVSTDYSTFSNIIEMRRVTAQLGWNNNVTLLSHSLGAHFSFIYSCIYPRQVESFISIDVARPITFQATNWNVTIANSIENHFKCEYNHEGNARSDSVVPVYTEAEALKRLMEAHSSSLTRESAKVLMKRGAREHKQGYTFNRDVRHRYLSSEFRPDDDLMMKYLDRSFSPNLFVIRSTKSPFRRPEETRLKYYEIFQRNCPLFRDKQMEGTHHLHMNTPDRVAAEINQFLDDVRMAKLEQEKRNCDANGAKSDKPPPIGKSNL